MSPELMYVMLSYNNSKHSNLQYNLMVKRVPWSFIFYGLITPSKPFKQQKNYLAKLKIITIILGQ